MRSSTVFSGRWEHVGVRYSHQPGVVGRDLASLAAERGADPVDILLDLALADGFETQVATAMRNGDDDEIAQLVAHPEAMIGASDAGAHVLANTDSCYAVWTLQHWVRSARSSPSSGPWPSSPVTRPASSGSTTGVSSAPAWPPTWSSSIPTGWGRPGSGSLTINRRAAGAW